MRRFNPRREGFGAPEARARHNSKWLEIGKDLPTCPILSTSFKLVGLFRNVCTGPPAIDSLCISQKNRNQHNKPETPKMTYYDIDSILAEEELMPCTALFDFSHLGHLEEDAADTTSSTTTDYLKEGTKLKMPLWALEKWSTLGYVNVQIPRHFNQKTREKLEADPLAVDLRYEIQQRTNLNKQYLCRHLQHWR
jgi:hypothetical protein